MTARVAASRVLLPILLVVLLVPAATVGTQGGVDKSLYVSVLDESGKPVKDMVADDILIREDGADRQVVAVKPASQPLSVAVLVDTAQGNRVTDAYGSAEEYVRDIRNSVGAFAKQLLGQSPNAVVSLMEFGQAAITIVPFTSNPVEFDKGINKLVAKPGVGSVLLEALAQANSDLEKQPSPRRAIVSLNLEPANEQSREDPKKIMDGFAKSGAQLWAVSVQRGGLKTPTRDMVLPNFTKSSGGQREYIVGISAVEGLLKSYADALTYQYEVVYKRPESNKPAKVIQIGTPRQGVKLHASGFAPK
jgi:von Willebrand factor type A domain